MAELRLEGVRMGAVSSAQAGADSPDTEFVFEQHGSIVSARYRGGFIVDGYLIGKLEGGNIQFRYVQVEQTGVIDAGISTGVFEELSDGRLRLIETFKRLTRPGAGGRVFEELPRDGGSAA